MTGVRRLFVVEHARHRVVASVPDAGQARAIAAMPLLGGPFAPERGALVVREPEDEKRDAFEARQRATPLTFSIDRRPPSPSMGTSRPISVVVSICGMAVPGDQMVSAHPISG